MEFECKYRKVGNKLLLAILCSKAIRGFESPYYVFGHLSVLSIYSEVLVLGIPIRPESISDLKTIRRNQVDQTQPWPIDTKHGLDLTKVTVADLNRPMTAENVIFMECQKMNYDPKQFSSELVKSLKSRKIKKENPGPAQETRIESEWQIEPEEEVLVELIVPDVNIHASMMGPKGQLILKANSKLFI